MFLPIFDGMNVKTPRQNGVLNPLPGQWQNTTFDATGSYKNSYEVVRESGPLLEIAKTRKAYTSISQSKDVADNRMLDSTDDIQTDGLQQMIWNAQEELLVQTQGDTVIKKFRSELIGFDGETQLSMNRIPTDNFGAVTPTNNFSQLQQRIQNWQPLYFTEKLPAQLAAHQKRYCRRDLEPEEQDLIESLINGYLEQLSLSGRQRNRHPNGTFIK